MNAVFLSLALSFLAINGFPAKAEGSDASSLSGAQKKSLKKCLASFSIEAAVEDKEFHDKNMMGVIEDARRYYSCEAFSRRKPDFFCKKLNGHWPLPPQARLEDNCIDQYNLYTVVQLNITGNPDAAKICQTLSLSARYLDGPWGGSTPEEECLHQTTTPGPGCKNIDFSRPELLLEPLGTTNCIEQHILHGLGNVCHLVKPSGIQNISEQWCLDVVAYRKSYEAKDIKLCGDSLACRMLMGKKDVCGGYLEGLRERFCRFSASKRPRVEAGDLGKKLEGPGTLAGPMPSGH